MTRTPDERQRALGLEHPVPRHVLLRTAVRLTGTAALLVLLYSVLPLQTERWWIGALIGLAAIGAILPFTIIRVQRIRSSDYPHLVAIEALLVLFTALVTGFAAIYLAIDRNGGQFDGLGTRIDAVYFTVTTLSTVGFGDITPIGQKARVLVVVQIILQFSLVAFGARLVMGAAKERVTDRLAARALAPGLQAEAQEPPEQQPPAQERPAQQAPAQEPPAPTG